MQETSLPQARAISEQGSSQRVYRPEVAPLQLVDGTPLYLEWIVEGEDGTLYRVPAEPGGWLRRSPYDRQPNKLTLVPSREASVRVRLTCADQADVARARYAFEHYDLNVP